MCSIQINLQHSVLRLFAAMVVAFSVVLPVHAQTLTGSLQLTVIDEEDIEVPGATITLEALDAAGNTPPKVTDENGVVFFNNLEPGEYEAQISHPELGDARLTGLLITNRQRSEIVALKEGREEVVKVVGQKPVDTSSTTSGQILTKGILQNTSVSRTYQDAVKNAAGVTGGSNPSMGGGGSNENTYLIDGENVTDPVTGTFGDNFNFDAIQQIEVILGGYMPEYGQSIGGVVNLQTRSGDNNLTFLGRVLYSNGNLRPRMDQRLTADGFVLAESDFGGRIEEFNVVANLGGPIVRDKAWFFLNYAWRRSLRRLSGVINPRDFDQNGLFAKLTVQPTSQHKFTVVAQPEIAAIDNIYQGSFIRAEAQGRQAQGTFRSQLRWEWFLSDKATLDSFISYRKSFIEEAAVPCTHNRDLGYHPCQPDEAENNVDYETPGRIGRNGAYDSVNLGQYYFDDRIVYTGQSNLSIKGVKDPFNGVHDIKMGVGTRQEVWDQIQGYSGNKLYIDINEVNFDPDSLKNHYWVEVSGPVKFRTTGSTSWGFIQDSWKPVSNFTVNYGTRYDYGIYRNDLGDPVTNIGMWGPRLFAAWDPFKDQKTKIVTGWGRFNQAGIFATASYASQAGYGSKIYFGEFVNQSWYSNTQEFMYSYNPSTNLNMAHDDLASPRVDEVIFQFEREAITDTALFSNVSTRFTRMLFEPDEQNRIYDEDGSAIIGQRLGTQADLNSFGRLRTPVLGKRDYVRWDLGFRKVESKRWTAQTTYSFTQSFGTSTQSLSGSFMNDPQTQFNYGPLVSSNVVHSVRSFGFWELPVDPNGLTLGYNFFYQSGLPLERFYFSENAQSGGVDYNLRVRPRGQYTQYAGNFSLDLIVTQKINLRKGNLELRFALANITSARAPTNYYATLYNENRLLVASRQSPLLSQFSLSYEF